MFCKAAKREQQGDTLTGKQNVVTTVGTSHFVLVSAIFTPFACQVSPCHSLLAASGGLGGEAPQMGDPGRGALQKILATFTFMYWSKTSNFGSNWHGALVNSSHLKCSSALTIIQNGYLVY